jgi:hypothetical protein
MTDDRAKSPRTLLVADHLWEAFAGMAVEMGADRDALINQALYTFARLNGFLVPASHRPPADPDRVAEIGLVEVDDPVLGDEGQATNMDLPNIAASLGDTRQPASIIAPQRAMNDVERGEPGGGGRTLALLADGRELDRVVKDRFLIGRGKHCDLIINSGKVSREHAAITREGSDYFIEDLGSSNGTWFDKRRISRRQIEEGDEYYICAEKLSCSFR